jgi:hypothetical protein
MGRYARSVTQRQNRNGAQAEFNLICPQLPRRRSVALLLDEYQMRHPDRDQAITTYLAAFIGVTPRQRLSGSSVKGRTMMSRTVHADLRRALYMPGLVARRHNPVLRALSTTGLASKAVVGAVMRKLAHLIYGVIKSGQPFDVSFAGRNLDFQDGI